MKAELNSAAALASQLTKASDTVDIHEFAGGLPQERGTMPQIRVGSRWFSTAQMLTVLIPVGFVGLLVLIATAQQLRLMPGVQAFIAQYPGKGSFATPVDDGFPWWLRYQHYLNFFLLLFMIRSGLQILAEHPRLYLDPDCTPGREWFRFRGPVPTDRVWTAKDDSVALPRWLGLPAIRHSIGLARMWHFSPDTLWLANGFWPNGKGPDSAEYRALLAANFVDYKLKVGGLVEHPQGISFAALKALPKSEQITQHYCIQGWSGVAKWGGVSMAQIMEIVRPKPEVRYAVFYSFAHGPGAHEGFYYDVHKIKQMAYPNTMLAYEMNGQPLPELHGAPLRLRNEVELGFKHIKWVQAVEFVENFAALGASEGGFNEDHEFFDVRSPI